MISKCKVCEIDLEYEPIYYMGRTIKVVYCDSCCERAKKEFAAEDESCTIKSLMAESNIPKIHLNKIESDKVKEFDHQEKALTYCPDDNLYPFLYGSPGTGKSFIASKLACDYVNKNKTSAYFTTMSDLKDLKFKDRSFYKHKISASFLVLDDVGNHFLNKFTIDMVKEVLDKRLNDALPTIITSNYNPSVLCDRMIDTIDEPAYNVVCKSILDRILELCMPIKVESNSIRKQMFLDRYDGPEKPTNKRKPK